MRRPVNDGERSADIHIRNRMIENRPLALLHCISVLLTNAIRVLSGDQDGTFIVPCPP